MKTIPLTKKDFLWTTWGEKDIKNVERDFIAYKKKIYNEIKKIPNTLRTFENTIYALESSDYDFESKLGYLAVLSSVSPHKKIRDIARKTSENISKKIIDIEYDNKIYEAIKYYANIKKSLKENLRAEDEKLFKDMLRGYKRSGFELSKEKRNELKKILKRKSKLSSDFSKNINEHKDFILVNVDELEGLPKRYIDGLKKDKKSEKYIITLETPDIAPFMVNAKSDKKRRELAEKELRKGGIKNIKILEEALNLSGYTAKLLGYKNYGDFVTEERMAKSSDKVLKFLNSLINKTKTGGKKELRELGKIKKEITGSNNVALEYYDIPYYSNVLRKKKFDIDSEALREYFPLEHVKKEMFKIFGNLFGISFQKINEYPLWHKDVELYSIKESGNIISYFLFDLFPRDGKYGHACVQDITQARNKNYNSREKVASLSCLITNFGKPTKKHPSLLSLGDVETFFHEFGHILHHSLSKTKYSSQSGFGVALDFVEVPSQILENWVRDEKVLKRISKHYKTGKSFSQGIIKNILNSKLHMVKYFVLRQNILGIFDMQLHTIKSNNVIGLYNKLTKLYTEIKIPDSSIFPASFGHILGGYGAGYYSYMWALVFADDMFGRFKKYGIMNKKIGMEYKKKILEKGASVDEMKLVENFLGRKPNNKAFLKEIGLS